MPLSPADTQNKLKQAVAHHLDGRIETAREIYRIILADHPDNPDALHLMGVAAHQTGDVVTAVHLIKKAVAVDARQPAYHNNLGNAYKDMGRTERAVACYRKAVALNPNYGEAWNNLGLVLHEQGGMDEAAVAFREAIRSMPEFADAYINLGVTFYARGRPGAAAAAYEKAAALAPEVVVGILNLAKLHFEQGRPAQALVSYQKAVERRSDSAEAHSGMGKSLLALGRAREAVEAFRLAVLCEPTRADVFNDMGTAYRELEMDTEAQSCFQKAISLNNALPEAHNNLGVQMRRMGRSDEAVSHYRQAVALRPDFPEAWFNLGNALADCGMNDDAFDAYKRALERNPRYIAAAHNLASLHSERGCVAEAIHYYELAIACDPEYTVSYGPLCYLLMQTCDWEKLAQYGPRLDALNAEAIKKGGTAPEPPFLNIARHADPELNMAVARSHSAAVRMNIRLQGRRYTFSGDRSHGRSGRRIRIGYISNNFRNHPTSHLMVDLFGLHDRDRFKIYCYSVGEDDGSPFRRKIRETCDTFRDFRGVPDKEAAGRIHEDGIDIYVDLMGQTTGSRMEIAAMRPAPIQVRYLGMAGTTGADYFDYIITDEIVTPSDASRHYTEKFIHLPHTYQINSRKIEDSRRKWHRRDAGLPGDAIVFCSFNSSYKIDPEMFRTWMRILKRVPGSVLWLQGGIAALEQHLKNVAADCGVSPDRIVFAEMLPHDQHLARLKLADLALDTRRVNGAATTSDVIWAGVPVVTIQGPHFASRMAASILNAIRMPELITGDLDEYEEKVVGLGQNRDDLAALRAELSTNRRTGPLFDTRLFVQHLETAFTRIWGIYQKGKAPRRIRVRG